MAATQDWIVVAGGAGYIGSHAVKALDRAGYRVVAYDSLVTGHREAVTRGELVVGDLADRAALRQLFSSRRVAAVMHFGAFIAVGESVQDPAKYYANNVAATLTLLDVMREHGCNKLIFSSTAAVYGEPEQVPIAETHPLRPINPYGWSKRIVEQVLGDYGAAYGLRSIAFRYFNAAGADPDGETGERHDPETHLVPLVLRAIRSGNPIKVFGDDYATSDGTCVRDYIHVSDLADAHLLGLERLLSGGESAVYNLGNGSGYSVREVLEAARRVTGREVPHVVAPRRAGDPAVLVSSSTKARTELGWRPQYASLEMIVETAWKWHAVHG